MFKIKHKLVPELAKAFPDAIVMQRKRHDGQVYILLQRTHMKTIYTPTEEVWESEYDHDTVKKIMEIIRGLPQYVDTKYDPDEEVEKGSRAI